MRVILRRNVENLGDMGSVVNVKDGYGRNYLIPRELAYFASESAVKRIALEKKSFAKKVAQEKELAEVLMAEITDLQISVAMKVGEEGKLYGSVNQAMISDELKLRGYDIDRKNIIIEDPIKSLGVFDIKIKLHPEVITSVKVWVISEEE
ncbi:MAG: 50S ribosomal protein L9 [bacterium]